MDVFLSEGIEIVFKVALALLTVGKNDLLSLDMESILKVRNSWNLYLLLYLLYSPIYIRSADLK